MPKSKKKDRKKARIETDGQESVLVAEPSATASKNGAQEHAEPMGRKEYERLLKPLHVELVKLQLWAQHAGLRVV
jgi:polyphosphate kinase 2 (PPK2 family)